MTEIAAFFERFDTLGHDYSPMELAGQEVLERAGAEQKPTFERLAERAGLDLDELLQEIISRVTHPAMTAMVRVSHGADPLGELAQLAGACGLQFFLAGAAWEQERHLPSLEG